jgi:serine/threonine-protein kinase
MAAVALLQPGLVLDKKYRVVRHIADGGMGAIYEAEHLTLGRRVAIKVLHPEFARSPEIVARFQQEARAAGAIGHQHIVEVLDLGRSIDGQFFLVMELLQGQNLAARVEQLGGRMAVGRAAHIMRQVLDALAAAHQRGIVHRDLKPENIFLVLRDGDPDFVKVLDFGISKVLTDDMPKMSTTGQVLGTPYFMSPEQTRGVATDHRVDIYACGAILYRLVTGRLPFTAPNFNALMFEIAGGRYYPPRSIVADIAPEFEQVIQYAMALDPAYRFQTAMHMGQAVTPFAQAVKAEPGPGLETGSETPSALRAFVPPPPGVAPTVAPMSSPAAAPARMTAAPRSKALPITVGAGVAVGVCIGLVLIRHIDQKQHGPAAAAVAKADARSVVTAPPADAAPAVAPPPVPVGPADAAPAAVAKVVPDAAPPPKPAPPKPEPPKPEPPPAPVVAAKATLIVKVDPADAPELVITVDGATAPGGTAQVATKRDVRIAVKAKGYAPASKHVTLTGDQTVEIKLTRKVPTGGPGGALGL